MEARLAERQLANDPAYSEMPFSEKSVVHLIHLEQRLATRAGKHETDGADPVKNR